MKNFIALISAICISLISFGQGGFVQIEQVNVDIQTQDGILLVSTIGEPIVGIDFTQGSALISGFYPLTLFEEGVSVKDVNPIIGLEAFPNPVYDKIILSFTEGNHPLFRVTVNDAEGKLLQTERWNGQIAVFELPFAAYTPGMYVITVSDPESARVSHLQVLKQ